MLAKADIIILGLQELIGELNSLVTFLQEHDVPADLGENMSGWMDKEFWNQLAKERIQA